VGQAVDYCPAPALYAICGTKEPQSATGEFAMRIDPKECHPQMDYTEHMKTYGLFCKLTAYTIIGVVAVMVILALFVA
jgi:Bacterial aa3 type cytochrome c oxidase subunit IV